MDTARSVARTAGNWKQPTRKADVSPPPCRKQKKKIDLTRWSIVVPLQTELRSATESGEHTASDGEELVMAFQSRQASRSVQAAHERTKELFKRCAHRLRAVTQRDWLDFSLFVWGFHRPSHLAFNPVQQVLPIRS